jgi:two-component system, cell cycle sensor histidine kinase and response regulator CckA
MTEAAGKADGSVMVARTKPVPRRRTLGDAAIRPLRIALGLAVLVALSSLALAGLAELQIMAPEAARLWLNLLATLLFAVAAVVALSALLVAAALRKEALPRLGLDALPIAHFVTDRTGQPSYANPASQALLPRGAPVAALRNSIDEPDRPAFDKLLTEVASGPARAVFPARILTGQAWLEISTQPLESGGRVLWRVEDITTAEAARRRIEAERIELLDFFDLAPVGLYSLDTAGRFVAANPTFASWLGATADALVHGQIKLQSLIWSDPEPRRTEFDPLAPAQDVEISLRGAGGVPVDIRLDQAVHRDPGEGRTISVARNLALDRLAGSRSARERFHRFFELAPVGIALIDAEARLQETNRALDELLTDSRERVLGHNLLDYIADDALAEVKARLAAISAGEQAARPIETRLKGAGGKTVALFVSRLEALDRTLIGLILHFIDLTEQKKLEVQFAQSQKMQAVGQLAGGVAHDFNNLLTAMIGFCDLLLLRFRPGDQSFADIMQIKQNANRAANLVRQLLAFSRQQTLQPRVIQIGEVLAELSHLLNRLLGENVELKMIHGRNLGPVRVDQGQLEQVIINLAVNARDAMPQGGTVTIRTANLESRLPFQRELEIMPPGAYVLIEVTDTGTGIPPEIISRIFEPFFSTKEVGSGTGLGLSTVYGIVKQTGGFIFVESEMGKGSKFAIYLPRHNEVEVAVPSRGGAETVETRAPQDLTGVGTVLLVEDEDPVRMFSARALRNKGYTVLEAKSGEQALKIIADGGDPIDLIITDVVMPRMDGPTLIKQVRETMPDVKVIFISGYTEDTFRKRLDNEQGIHFLPKPFSLKQLASKAKEIMTGATPGA